MNYFERRRYKKSVKHLLREARHARYTKEDILPESDIEKVKKAEDDLKKALHTWNANSIDKAAEKLMKQVNAIMPSHKYPRMRENVEILVVAITVALAFRTYFIQPFKIPTGSMQPTLNGITVTPQTEKEWSDQIPFKFVKLALFGERFKEVRAKASGPIQNSYRANDGGIILVIGNKKHKIYQGQTPETSMRLYFNPDVQTYFKKGQLIASGSIKYGDHIFVNKMRYNFKRPERGDIFVFDTSKVAHEMIRKDTFYIKRLVGLPGERISIDPPHLIVDGKTITDPYPFKRLVEEKENGYNGYLLPANSLLHSPTNTIDLTDRQYLPFGDNTLSSLDGRYFGGVTESSIVGPAFMVYWPLSKRWGFVE